MKFRYFLGVALSALLMTGCSDNDTIGTFGDIILDQSFVKIPDTGGSVAVVIRSTGDWKFDGMYQKITKNSDGTRDTTYTELPNNPAWLTASALSGGAGESTVIFNADATNGGREAELRIDMNGKKQFLVIRQGSLEASNASCADVIAGPDSKNYRVTGICTKIANTTYGNWYLNDGTGEIYIYGTNDKEGKKGNNPIDGTDGWKFEVGDEITVEGPKTTYGSTIELVDVTVVKIKKSLIKVVTEDKEIAKEGGDFDVKVAYKGSGAFFDVPEDALSWLSYVSTKYIPGVKTIFETNPSDTAVFKFRVLPNEGETRKTAIEFTSASGSDVSSVTFGLSQEANVLPHGQNPDDPYSVAEAIAKCKEIGSTSDGVIYYAKGVISSISSIDTGSYGNATFNISDDGSDDKAITCFRSFFLDNAKFTAADQIGVGDEVVITGKLVNYKGTTPEFSGNVYVYFHKKASNEPGTKNNPFTISQAIAYIDGGGKDNVYVKGIVSELYKGGFGAEYGNGSFYISDDGTKYGDASKDFEAYQVNWLGNVKWTEGTPQIAVGDVVVLYGPLTKYKTTYETQGKGAAYIYSLNGNTK